MTVYRIMRCKVRNGTPGHASPLSSPTRERNRIYQALANWATLEGGTMKDGVVEYPRQDEPGVRVRLWVEET